MELSHAILLGIVQGLGEFLPISSSAHLVILPWFMDFKDPGLAFDVALHLGTLISLLAFFYKDWITLTKSFFTSLSKKPAAYNFDEKLIWFLIIGSVPAAIAGVLIEDYAETVLRSPLIVALMMAVFGIILYLADHFGKKSKDLAEITFKDTVWVGLAQCLALIPGSSRSGVTISMGMFRKMNRNTAARFSFLLSTPIVAGAALLKLPKFFSAGIGSAEITGIVVSAVVGYLSIKYMLHFLRTSSYSVYVVYRLLFAGLVLGMLWFRK